MARRLLVLGVLVCAIELAFATVPRALAMPRSGQPVVHAVLFWAEGCEHCEVVLQDALPGLQTRYGQQLQVQMIEVSGPANYAVFRQLEEHYQVPGELRGVPALFIGDRLLVGEKQIPTELPGLIDYYLGQGGVDYPRLPGLAPYLPAGAGTGPLLARVSFKTQDDPSRVLAASTANNGFVLAIVIMVGMALAVIYALITSARAGSGAAISAGPAWAETLIPVLAVIGLGVAGYLTFVETQNVVAVCGPVGDCNSVQTSPYSRLFGFLPVGLLGLLGYVGILGAWLAARFGPQHLAALMRLAIFGMALFGVLFSLYLTYLEPFVIGAVCIWCLSSAVLITLIMLLSLGPALSAMVGTEEEYEEYEEA